MFYEILNVHEGIVPGPGFTCINIFEFTFII